MCKIILSLLLSFFYVCLFGQQYISNVTHFDQKDGLSHNQVKWIHKDQKGLVWVGAANGVNRFDGQSFKMMAEMNFFHAGNPKVFEDWEGDIWLSIKNPNSELTFFNTITGKSKTFEEKFGSKAPFSKYEFHQGLLVDDQTIAIGTKDGRLIYYHKAQKFESRIIRKGYEIIPRAKTKQGAIWLQIGEVQTKDGQSFDEFMLWGNESKPKVKRSIPDILGCIGLGEQNQLLIYSASRLISLSPDGEMTSTDFDRNLFYNNRVAYDPASQRFWSATQENIYILNKSGQVIFDLFESYPALNLLEYNSFLLDNQNIFWVGSMNGLLKIESKPNPFNRLLYEKDVDHNRKLFKSCRGIDSDQFGNIYVNAILNTYKINQDLEAVAIDYGMPKLALYKDLDGFLWTGGNYNFRKINPIDNSIQTFGEGDSSLNHYVWSFYKDRNNRLWISSENGLFYKEEHAEQIEVFEDYNDFENVAKEKSYTFYKDQQDQIWLTTTNGLFLLDLQKGITERYWPGGDTTYFIPSKDLRHMHQDGEGVFWIASREGLIRWDKTARQTRLFTTEDGFSNNHIYAVYEDNERSEFLWMSSDNGIIQFNKRTFKVKNYFPSDGITHREFNRVSHHQAADGTIYFGGLNGVTSFHPRDFHHQFDEQPQTPLILTDCELFSNESNQQEDRMAEFRETGKITMAPDDRYLNLQFSLLDYSTTNPVQYAYKINYAGATEENDWNIDKENSVRLGALPYGNHTLIIKGRLANGLYSKDILQIPITVLRPFYLQWWFMGLTILTLLFIGFLSTKARTKMFLNRQRELEAIVTDRTQTILAQADELRELDKAKSKFLANISHEFRTPLTLILNTLEEEEYAGLLHSNHPSNQQIFDRRDVVIMRRNAHRLQHLINQLLDLSKLEAGKMSLQTEQGDFCNYLQSLVESFRSLAEKKNIHLSFITAPIEIALYFDRDKTDKIFYNLLSNAIKFTPEGGSITVALQTSDNKVNIKIKDTGIGIEADDLHQVFDRFYQVKTTDEFLHEGTGIGLALVKELIEIHYGKIEVESNFGIGTSFNISLPLGREHLSREEILTTSSVATNASKFDEKQEDLAGLVSSQSSPKDQQKPLLLIIEDNDDLRQHQQRRFEKEYHILSAADGTTGLALAFEHIPDLIICDVMMPGKNGYEVCETLKTDERTNHIPVILLTAKVASESKIKGLGIGADDFISKPYHHQELVLKLRNFQDHIHRIQQQFKSSLNLEEDQVSTILTQDPFVLKVKELIEANLANPNFNVEELSQMLLLSRSQLFRKLKALTGETATNLIRTYRLQKAKQLLEDIEGNATEVSYMVGFSNPTYFFKCFKKEFGMTPKELLSTPKSI